MISKGIDDAADDNVLARVGRRKIRGGISGPDFFQAEGRLRGEHKAHRQEQQRNPDPQA
jgi:hypothetical protein